MSERDELQGVRNGEAEIVCGIYSEVMSTAQHRNSLA